MNDRNVVITGIGLVSTLGVGLDAHAAALADPALAPEPDAAWYPPFVIHKLPEIDWSAQIPKRQDQRQMETWQRLGTFTAGLALDDAGMKDNEALCGTMDMIVAAAGGERDVAVDDAIIETARTRDDLGLLLNERLTTDLRPTLFLAQLSNLLAGNISIVHKVTGSSRTFMGEESAGVSALGLAAARIRAGQSTHALVGGAFQTEHPDSLLIYELGRYLHRGAWQPVGARQGSEGGGVVSGSGAAFLVLEDAGFAAARGARPLARLSSVTAARANRAGGSLEATIADIIAQSGARPEDAAFSAASGAHAATAAEAGALGPRPVRAFSSLVGHLREAQFPFAVALAALSVSRGIAPPPFRSDLERPIAAAPSRWLCTGVGHHRGEGACLVEAVGGTG